mgnify:FL=1|tara:strand:+ start:195 stop:398 length:204 start_codon:yes stop_codon:yes gene_type:complete
MLKTSKINMVINLAILGLLIYLAVAVKELQEKVFPDPNVMIPLSKQMDGNFEDAVKNLLIQKLKEIE